MQRPRPQSYIGAVLSNAGPATVATSVNPAPTDPTLLPVGLQATSAVVRNDAAQDDDDDDDDDDETEAEVFKELSREILRRRLKPV